MHKCTQQTEIWRNRYYLLDNSQDEALSASQDQSPVRLIALTVLIASKVQAALLVSSLL